YFTARTGFLLLCFISVFLILFAPRILNLFREDIDVVRIGSATLRFQAITLPLHAFIVATNMLMQSTGKSMQATFLSCNRQGVYFIPLIFILPSILGLTGIELTQALADVLSAITAIPYIVHFMKNLPEENIN
ncbi:MAG: MATE family efflux transporter, partial [Treponema sp.]|nr:MATE family efflux transporter [Treponema sp.]